MIRELRTSALIIAIILIRTSGFTVSAQDRNPLSIGTFHSPKGFGICLEANSDSVSFDAATLIADMHGVLTGEHPRPGVKFTYTRNIILKHFDKEGYFVDLYAGPGLTAGYAHDISKPLCLIAGMSGVAGSRFTFSRNLSINIELCTDIALELCRNSRYGNIDLSLYKSGINHFFFPQLRIHYIF